MRVSSLSVNLLTNTIKQGRKGYVNLFTEFTLLYMNLLVISLRMYHH